MYLFCGSAKSYLAGRQVFDFGKEMFFQNIKGARYVELDLFEDSREIL